MKTAPIAEISTLPGPNLVERLETEPDANILTQDVVPLPNPTATSGVGAKCMGTRTQTIQAKPDELVRLADFLNSQFFYLGGLGGCPSESDQQAEGAKVARNKRKKYKPLLSRLEQDVAILSRHKFELESAEEMRQSLLKKFISLPELSTLQKNAIHNLANPLRSKSKKVKTDRRRKKHYVYAISDGAFVKIGLAVDPQKRLGDLQVASPSILEIEATIECPRYGTASGLEKKLHRACKKYHVRGEWFEMDALSVFDKFQADINPEPPK